MIEKEPLSDSLIIDTLKRHYAIRASAVYPLFLGADQNSTLYKAITFDQKTFFIKLRSGPRSAISAIMAKFLQEAGVLQIIAPLYTLDQHLTQTIKDRTMIVYPFIEGKNGFTRSLTPSQWIALGKTLKQLHEIDAPLSIQNSIRTENFSSQWRDSLQSILAQLKTLQPVDEWAFVTQNFLLENQSTVHFLVDRAQELAEKNSVQASPYVLCHSDIHAGNILMEDGDNFYIVDWDDPIMAPKERDLMFIGGGVGNVWNKPEEEKYFYQGYGETQINPSLLTYYRCERIVEDIAIYCQELLGTSSKKEEPYKYLMSLFESNGVVDIALKNE